MVLSIRSMLTEFFCKLCRLSRSGSGRFDTDMSVLMALAVFCFLGFVYALFTLAAGRFELSQIGWWLLEVYFGLDASGFESARKLSLTYYPSCLTIAHSLRRFPSIFGTASYGVICSAIEHFAVDGAGGYFGEHFRDDQCGCGC